MFFAKRTAHCWIRCPDLGQGSSVSFFPSFWQRTQAFSTRWAPHALSAMCVLSACNVVFVCLRVCVCLCVCSESLGWWFRWISYISPMKYGECVNVCVCPLCVWSNLCVCVCVCLPCVCVCVCVYVFIRKHDRCPTKPSAILETDTHTHTHTYIHTRAARTHRQGTKAVRSHVSTPTSISQG